MASTLTLLEIQDPGHLQNTIITIKGADGTIAAGANGIPGRFILRDKNGRETIQLNGQTGEVAQSGDIILKDGTGKERVRISGQSAEIIIKSASGERVVELGKQGNLYLGGGGEGGDVVVRTGTGLVTVRLDGQAADLHVGANGQAGDMFVNNAAGKATIHLDGSTGNIELNGELKIKDWALAVPDYVFAADHKLMRLDDLKDYIATNCHLPDIPSAAEVAREGLNIGQFVMLLLKKIEEMSLHLIWQEQVINEQGERLQRLEHPLSDR